MSRLCKKFRDFSRYRCYDTNCSHHGVNYHNLFFNIKNSDIDNGIGTYQTFCRGRFREREPLFKTFVTPHFVKY
jgi:hypothetical protein